MSNDPENQEATEGPSLPVWKRHRVVVDVDVMAIDARGNSFFIGSREAARLAVQDMVVKDENPGFVTSDREGCYASACHGQVKIRYPVRAEEGS